MTDLKNIYDYLEKINFEKRIKEEVKFIRDRKNNPDFEIIVSPFVMTQFVFSILQDFYEEIHKDIEKENQKLKELLKECKRYIDIWGYTDTHGNALLPQINQAIGEE